MSDGKKSTEIPLPREGAVDIAAQPTATEKEIAEDLKWVTIHLDGIYWPLADAMRPFQDQWDRCGENWAAKLLLLENSKSEGAREGVRAWSEDLGDIFDGETWEKVGTWVSDATSAVADRIGEYAGEQKKRIDALLEKPGETVWNWSWWAKQASEVADSVAGIAQSAAKTASDTVGSVNAAANTAAKIWKHREAIANLPEILASGESKRLQQFVDTALMDIDPKMAEEIRNDPDFHATLELVDDPEAVLTYLEYTSLVLEAIPPNFYAYIGGKAGTYIAIEIVLMVALAFLGGAGVGARIAALAARLTATAAKAATANKKIAGAVKAIEALADMLNRLAKVGGDLRALGQKLAIARRRGVRASAATKNTAVVKRRGQKRGRKCAMCHSIGHATPNIRRGNVKYN